MGSAYLMPILAKSYVNGVPRVRSLQCWREHMGHEVSGDFLKKESIHSCPLKSGWYGVMIFDFRALYTIVFQSCSPNWGVLTDSNVEFRARTERRHTVETSCPGMFS